MNYRAILAASAALSFVFTSTAAMADDDDDVSGYYSQVITGDTTGMTPDQICAATIHPAVPSGFTAQATDVTPGSWTNVGAAYPDLETGPLPNTAHGYGTPSASGLQFDGTYFRNGGSPNLWGGATAGTLTYSQTEATYNFLQDVTRTTTFGCYVFKVVGENSPNGPHTVVPPGLQSTGNSLVESDTVPANPATGSYVTNDQFVDSSGATPLAVLICISPGSKGGKWTGKNTFPSSQCQSASTSPGVSQWIPSGNVPIN
jgi:hypothetical protein